VKSEVEADDVGGAFLRSCRNQHPHTRVQPSLKNATHPAERSRRSIGLGYIGAAMRHLAGFAIACAVMGSAGCFSDRLPPPTFRYSCSVDDDCTQPEACIRGLCQIPCRQATFRDDCPAAGSYLACFNGVCSNVCTVGADHCTQPQSCIELPLDLAGSNGGGGFGGGGGASSDAIGLCGVECTPGDDVCPSGEVCLQGFCVQGCMFDAECQDGFSCIFGVCLPSDVEVPDTDGTGGTGLADETTGLADETSTGGTR
jgi:hypothetical protein